jgi:hypothetical protein
MSKEMSDLDFNNLSHWNYRRNGKDGNAID